LQKAFGTDFSSVRVHTDSGADTLNKELNAKAFTTGQDIFFRRGEYSPGSDGGKKLIAHELTHVVQQGVMRSQSSPKPENASRKTVQAMGPNVRLAEPSIQRIKSKAEIEERRRTKKVVLNTLIELAKIGLASCNIVLPKDRVTKMETACGGFTGLDHEILKTAKGFNSTPAGAELQQNGTFSDWLDQLGRNCGSGAGDDAKLWAEQLARRNPKNIELQTIWSVGRTKIKEEVAAWEAERGAYTSGKPHDRPPQDVDEAKYFLVWYRNVQPIMDQNYWDDYLESFKVEFEEAPFTNWTYKTIGGRNPDAFRIS
jgi:hypothetical protein